MNDVIQTGMPLSDAGLAQASPLTQRLQALLGMEFEALKIRDLPQFETPASRKKPGAGHAG